MTPEQQQQMDERNQRKQLFSTNLKNLPESMKTAQALLATLAPKLAGSSFSPLLSGALSLLLDNGDSIGNFMPVIFGKQPTAEGGYPRMYTPDATMSLEKAKHVGPIEQTINRRLADMAYYIRDVNVAMRRRSMANRYEIVLGSLDVTVDQYKKCLEHLIQLCQNARSDYVFAFKRNGSKPSVSPLDYIAEVMRVNKDQFAFDARREDQKKEDGEIYQQNLKSMSMVFQNIQVHLNRDLSLFDGFDLTRSRITELISMSAPLLETLTNLYKTLFEILQDSRFTDDKLIELRSAIKKLMVKSTSGPEDDFKWIFKLI